MKIKTNTLVTAVIAGILFLSAAVPLFFLFAFDSIAGFIGIPAAFVFAMIMKPAINRCEAENTISITDWLQYKGCTKEEAYEAYAEVVKFLGAEHDKPGR